ncbi:protein unc-13 homolog 4B-like [Periplaneta americana]|uniref:protein unc-13 homolog 4B-like n=1 Tax=Periplaneta americana TaxID=6978 RepID=UPI0037E7E61E
MYELYSEILYRILNSVGSDAIAKDEHEGLLYYLQEAFRIENDKHILLLEKARKRKAPSVVLNINVFEAKNLKPSDPNGLSDPFCTVYLTSDSAQFHTTCIKTETLNPVWEEDFTLPVKDPDKDVLCLEVWDFDDEETTREKLKKIKEVKGVKGIKIFMREVMSSTNDNDLIGSSLIPLKDIPAVGKTLWCTLEKNGKMKSQGSLKVQLFFSSENDSKTVCQQHRQLLYNVLLHEILTSKEESLKWNGKWSNSAERIITEHHVQCGLPALCVTLAEWIEYINVHVLHPLSYSIFPPLLKKLVQAIQDGTMTEEEEIDFWDAARKLLASCMSSIQRLQIEALENKNIDQTSAILSILSVIAALDSATNHNIHTTVIETIYSGTNDWFEHAIERTKVNECTDEEEKLNNLVNLTDLVISSLRKAVSSHDKLFQEHFHFPYAKELYKVYECQLINLAEPIVKAACKNVKPVTFCDVEEETCENEILETGASLFQLYLSLHQLSGFGKSLCSEDSEIYLPQNFYQWFYPAALQWIYISCFKSQYAINKAIYLDQFTSVDDCIQYSSSAIDTLHIFDQIRIFWKRLAWPDHEAAFTFATNIIDDICQCAAFYADKVIGKVERICESESLHKRRFEVTKEWCIAIKDINYVQESIKTTVLEFGLEELISSLVSAGKCSSSEICKQTMHLMLESGINIVSKKVREMLQRASEKMIPTINKLLLEVDSGSSTVDQLMEYLDTSLCTLNSQLSSENFEYILAIIWKNVSNLLCVYMERNMRVQREPSFYKKQQEILNIIVDFFMQGNESIVASNLSLLKKMDHMLHLHGMETQELIHQYYLEKQEEQKAMETALYGLLTVRLQFAENMLRIEIMNARNLQPLHNKDSCNPYVTVSLLPEERFTGTKTFVSKTHKKVLYALFEETFVVELSPNQKNLTNGLVMFTIKDHCLLATDKVLAETYAPFSDITKTDLSVSLQSMEQLHLKLNRSNDEGSETFETLQKRDDKDSRDFVKNRRRMFPASDYQIQQRTKT